MRLRLLAPLSLLAAGALALSGCAGGEDPEATPTSSPAAAECLLDPQPGAASDQIEVSGTGSAATVTFTPGVEITEIERTVVGEPGTGEQVVAGDLVELSYQILDAGTGELIESSAQAEGGVTPMLLDPQQSSLFIAALECLPLGTQTAMTIPSTQLGEGAPSVVVVATATEKLPARATGVDKDPAEGMPTVTLADNGAPTITLPGTEAPGEVEISVLKQGDGPVVGANDYVTVQYTGIQWSDGAVFDSSWDRGAPAGFPVQGVVDGFRQALEGQQVGSQVLVVIPPAAGYGGQEGHRLQNETLVFVVDILATQPGS